MVLEPELERERDRSRSVTFPFASTARLMKLVVLENTKKLATSIPTPTALNTALRGGHHCNQPLMHKLGVESTARASFYFYNTTEEIDQFTEVLKDIQKFFDR